MLLGYLLWYKQWPAAPLTIIFTWGFYYAGPFFVLAPLIGLVVGWQEADQVADQEAGSRIHRRIWCAHSSP